MDVRRRLKARAKADVGSNDDDTGSPPADGDGPDKSKSDKSACVVVNFPPPDDGWTEDEKEVIAECRRDGMTRHNALHAAAVYKQNKPARKATKRVVERKRKRKKGGVSGHGQSRPRTPVHVGTCPTSNTPLPSDSAAPSVSDHDACGEGGSPKRDSPQPTLRNRFPSEYQSWLNMKKRRNAGFSVDRVWLGVGGFETFLGDMGSKPTLSHTLDRNDPADRRYGPGLCRWSDKKTQTRNRRNTIFLTDRDDVRRSLGEWAEVTGVKYDVLYKRYRRHRDAWTQDQIIYNQAPADVSPSAENFECWPGDDAAQVWWAEQYRLYRDHVYFETKAKFVVRICCGWMRDLTEDLPPADNPDGETFTLTADELDRVERCKRAHAVVEKYRQLDDPKKSTPHETEADEESQFGYYGQGYEYD